MYWKVPYVHTPFPLFKVGNLIDLIFLLIYILSLLSTRLPGNEFPL